MRIKNNYIPHIYTPLMDKALFDKVQQQLSGKATIHAKTEYGSLDFALRGLFRCAKCGCVKSSELHTKKSGKQYIYLKCSHLHGNCDQKPINEADVFEQIENELTGTFNFSPEALRALKDSVREHFKKETIFNNTMKQQLETKLTNTKARLDHVVNLLIDCVITKEVYDNKTAQLKKRSC